MLGFKGVRGSFTSKRGALSVVFVAKVMIFCHALFGSLSLAFAEELLGEELQNKASFSVLTWNIQKGLNTDWTDGIVSYPSDIYVLQEATSEPEVLLKLSGALDPSFTHVFNSSWTMPDGYDTGTMSLSHFDLINSVNILSIDTEPLVATPKSMLVADYNVPGCGVVRVINLHMINFNLGGAYKRQLKQLTPYIDGYEGPLVVAGDFNNWNAFRDNNVRSWAKKLNLNYVKTERNTWLLTLDHIFYKGPIKLESAKELDVDLSDHYPLRASFVCD